MTIKNCLRAAAAFIVVVVAPAVAFAGPNCTNTCNGYCGANYESGTRDHAVCFEGCIYGCVNGPEAPQEPTAG